MQVEKSQGWTSRPPVTHRIQPDIKITRMYMYIYIYILVTFYDVTDN